MSYKIFKDHHKETKEIRVAIVDALIAEAKINDKIVILDADLMSASGLSSFQKEFPARSFNMGIMEAHMAGAAAGLSITGFMPFIHSFAPFASRRIFDQLVVSGAYSNNSITVIGTDPGINAIFNGGTHTALEDLAMFRSLPNTMIFEVSDCVQADAVIKYRLKNPQGLCYIRAARRPLLKIYEEGSTFKVGEFPTVREGKDITIFTTGIMVSQAIDAANLLEKDNISVRIIDCFSLSIMDVATIKKAVNETKCLVAIDNHNIHGGVASAIADILVEFCPSKLNRIGMESFSEVGDLNYLLDRFGFSAEKIAEKIKSFL